MSSYSFVVPVLNEGERLRPLLDRLTRDFPGAERIVVDGGSSDDSVARALHSGATVLLSQPGRATQMNLGAAGATGDYLCFLHADTEPRFNGEALGAALDEKARWGFCRVRLRSERFSLRVVGAFINWRSKFTGVATGDQLLIVERRLFEELGGFAAIPLMEDVDISKRLRGVCAPQILPHEVSTSARRWERDGVVLTVLRMWALRLAYWLGVSPQRLWQHYYGKSEMLADASPGEINEQ